MTTPTIQEIGAILDRSYPAMPHHEALDIINEAREAVARVGYPDIGVQDFASGNLTVMEEGQYRYVRFEDCPSVDETCDSEHHHYGRGDHVVPLDPDWIPA